jgi:hypothetical protein
LNFAYQFQDIGGAMKANPSQILVLASHDAGLIAHWQRALGQKET